MNLDEIELVVLFDGELAVISNVEPNRFLISSEAEFFRVDSTTLISMMLSKQVQYIGRL